MRLGKARIGLPFPRGLFGHCIRQHPQGLAGLQGADIGLGGAFKIVKPVEGLGHGLPDDQHPMVAHHHRGDLGVRQHRRTARAFFFKRHAAIVVIHHMPAKKHRAVLVNRRKAAVGQTGQHSGVDRMDVQHTARMGQGAVNAAVQPPSRWVRRIGAVHRRGVVGVDFHQGTGGDPAEMPPVGVDEKP